MEKDLRYPVGKFQKPSNIQSNQIELWIKNIGSFPKQVADLTKDINPITLNWRYRPDGWTIYQVIHHCADSHMNAIIRFKLALTENNPTIKPYKENLWAELTDTKDLPVDCSLQILNGLHKRWEHILKSLSEEDLKRTLIHPQQGGQITVAQLMAQYDWHCRHHLGHIKQALESNGSYK